VPEYLRYVAGLKGVPYKEIKNKVAGVMEQVGLTHMAHKFIGELSKGYRQRVGLAQALINDPDVLILDEPTIGLDPKQIIEIRSLIGELGTRRTIILSSHILPEVSMICKRVIIIDEGKIKAMDTPENLISQLHQVSRVQARISGTEKDVMDGLKGLEGVKVVKSLGEKAASTNVYLVEFGSGLGSPHLISRMASEKKWDLYELSPMQMSLEDIFIKIVTKEEVNS
jgi:ABC-2 type transport system ATP-binding protein